MQYKYIFHSPVKYWVVSNDENYNEVLLYNEINHNNILQLSNDLLYKSTIDFEQYMNNRGLLKLTFKIINDILETVAIFDHKLIEYEFKDLYINLQHQLIEGIGKNISETLLLQFDDKIEYVNSQGMSEYKPTIQNVYCLLWQYDDWALSFVQSR